MMITEDRDIDSRCCLVCNIGKRHLKLSDDEDVQMLVSPDSGTNYKRD